MYLKTAYNSIRKHHGYIHEIIMLDDASEDGTWEWLQEIDKKDIGVKIHRNDGPKLGHTILYDVGVDMCSNEIFSIFHADMICSPLYVENLFLNLNIRFLLKLQNLFFNFFNRNFFNILR